ncbi:hypothetical protein FA95DRAFT_1613895 [Auriscalpium vulgare]|uniref:Uncharacterized protein n=1 Tax=Auriscalpium vulgare TaxID=40419 RepID=A0ACB8R1A6_9AGAM|nr:hypothetical protein FA95DRAFT_1613895 [Auriscalpium vulgare]
MDSRENNVNVSPPQVASSYWADAAALRVAQIPSYRPSVTIPANLHAAEEKLASVLSAMDAIALAASKEKKALRAAMHTLHCHHEHRQAGLRVALRDAFAERNALLPFNCLPIEVFEKILMALSAVHPITTGKLGWISGATHVCRAWRRIALGFPALWATIELPFPGCPELAATVFTRAQSALLSITASVHGANDGNVNFIHAALAALEGPRSRFPSNRCPSVGMRPPRARPLKQPPRFLRRDKTPEPLDLVTQRPYLDSRRDHSFLPARLPM